MVNDPAEFGGFRYDTSHARSDKPPPALVQARSAQSPTLILVTSLLQSYEIGTPEFRELINTSRRWTEVDYMASVCTKEFEWYGLTPLVAADSKGHDTMVEHLLRSGVDPTLGCCSEGDIYVAALGAA